MPTPLLRRYRLQAGIDQAELAKELQISQAQMSRLESGKVPLTAEQLFFLADYFDAPDLLLEYIQPILARALEMVGAKELNMEFCLVDLLRDCVDNIAAAVDVNDRPTAEKEAAKMASLSQIARVLLTRDLSS